MSKLDALRKIIREEVRTVVREELKFFMKENNSNIDNLPVNKTYANTLKEEIIKSKKVKIEPTGDPILDLLNETQMSMTSEDYRTVFNGESRAVQGFPSMMSNNSFETPVVETVDQMLATARPATDVTQVNIDAVPDFSALMKNMKDKGQL
jgi:hypothetical protein